MSDDDVIASVVIIKNTTAATLRTVQKLIGHMYISIFSKEVRASATDGRKSMIVQTGKSKLHQYQVEPVGTELMAHAKERGQGEGRGSVKSR